MSAATWLRPLALAALLGAAGAACANDAPAQQAAHERARLQREEAEAEAAFRARQAACQKQFVVTPCVDEAKAERRRRLEQLRGQRAVIDDAERRRRAAERLADIEQRQRERAAAQAAAASAPPRAVRTPATLPPPRPAAEPREPADRRAEEAQAARRAASRAQRASEAAERRQKVESRNAGKPPAPTLPVPASVPP